MNGWNGWKPLSYHGENQNTQGVLGVLPESEEHCGELQHVQTALGVHKKSGLSVKDKENNTNFV